MTKNSIFRFLCIYNLTYDRLKPFIEILTRSPVTLALFPNFARPPLIELGNARDWVEAGNDVIQSTQNHFSKKCDF